MRQRISELVLSKTGIEIFLSCPREYYFNYLTKLPKRTDYPRLLGSVFHSFIRQMCKPVKDSRTFFYKTKKSAINAWIRVWKLALEESKSNLIETSAKQDKKYLGIGAYCLARYWNANVDLPRPIEIETRYSHQLFPGLRLLGVFDQLRHVPIDYVRAKRPDLVVGDKLVEGYDQIAIVDLKTGAETYDLRVYKKDATLEEEALHQFSLHEGLQPTMYIWLYERVKGKKPIGFVQYELRGNRFIFTHRTEEDYQVLYDKVRHLTSSLDREEFPKNEGRQCKYCDFSKACREDRPLLVSHPDEPLGDARPTQNVPNDVKMEEFKQKRLRLKYGKPPAKKREEIPPDPPSPLKQIEILKFPPWHDPNVNPNPEEPL